MSDVTETLRDTQIKKTLTLSITHQPPEVVANNVTDKVRHSGMN